MRFVVQLSCSHHVTNYVLEVELAGGGPAPGRPLIRLPESLPVVLFSIPPLAVAVSDSEWQCGQWQAGRPLTAQTLLAAVAVAEWHTLSEWH